MDNTGAKVFDVEVDEAKRRAAVGPLFLFARRIFGLVLTFISMVTVARLVGPKSFGLANMAMITLYLAQILRDFGLTNAILRKDNVKQEEISFIFWFNLVFTLLLAAAVAALAPVAAKFYSEPIISRVIIFSLLGFIAAGIASQHRALLNRDLRFGAIALIDTLSILAGFVVSLTMALLKPDVWAIVTGVVVQMISSSVLCVAASRWIPSRPGLHDEARSLMVFGANTAVFSLSVFLSGNIGPIIIGHTLGAGSLGQYSRAWAIFNIPSTNLVEPIAQATMPLLNRLRSQSDQYRSVYLSLVRRLCVFLMPMSVGLTFAASPLTNILLGKGWHEAGQVLAALAPSFAVMGLGYSLGDLFITQNRAKELRSIGIFETVVRVLFVCCGVRFGVVGAALGYSFATFCVVAGRLLVAGRAGPVSSLDQVKAAALGVPVGFGSLLGCSLVSLLLPSSSSNLFRTILLFSGTIIGGLTLGGLVPSCRAVLFELAETFGSGRIVMLLKTRRGATA